MRRHAAALLVGALLLGASCGDNGEPESTGIPETPGTAAQEALAETLGFSSWAVAENTSSLYCTLLADVEGRTDFEAEVRQLEEQRTNPGPFDTVSEETEAIVLLTEQVCPEVHERITR
jgi:hypothetical protein